MIGKAFSWLFGLLRKVHLLVWILIWTVIGIFLGLFAPDFSKNYMGLLSTHVFLPMVKCIIVPLVFGTLVVGISLSLSQIDVQALQGTVAISQN